MMRQHLIGRAFSQLLRLKALVIIMTCFLVIVAHNVRKIFDTLWHLLAPRARHGSI